MTTFYLREQALDADGESSGASEIEVGSTQAQAEAALNKALEPYTAPRYMVACDTYWFAQVWDMDQDCVRRFWLECEE